MLNTLQTQTTEGTAQVIYSILLRKVEKENQSIQTKINDEFRPRNKPSVIISLQSRNLREIKTLNLFLPRSQAQAVCSHQQIAHSSF